VISFRYHVVSLIGVFLALALGIVVGTTALNGPITTDLRHQVETLKNDRSTLAGQVKTLSGQVSDAQRFASDYGPQIVKGTLTGQSVIVLGMPGADSKVKDAIVKGIAAAGGKVTGRLQLTADYTDPKRAGDITALVTGSAHPVGLTLPQTSDPGVLGGALLAYVLMGRGQQTDLRQVLASFSGLHMIKVESADVAPAPLVAVVTAGTLPTADAGGQTELALVTQLQAASAKVVLSGDTLSATAGGLVALVRKDDLDKTAVSTVDNADTAMGQVSAVLALSAAARNQNGHYGTAPGVERLFPEPPK
jgi:hypothetical protein